jgi:threonine dehydrogenase-like Zn-dependent dehydrogenase
MYLNVNPGGAGGSYGYVDMGGWVGGQVKYVMVPYADLNLTKFPDTNQALEKIRDFTMLSDILPTASTVPCRQALASGQPSTPPAQVQWASPPPRRPGFSARALCASAT